MMTPRQKEVMWTIGDWAAWSFEVLFRILWTTAKLGGLVAGVWLGAVFVTSRFVPRW